MNVSALTHWFAQPAALWLLGLVPILGFMAALTSRWRRRVLVHWGVRAAREAWPRAQKRRSVVRGLMKAAGLILLVFGIAGLQWGQVADLQTAPGRDMVIVLDASRSMLAQDVLGRSSPNRLGRAKDSVIDLLDYVQRRGGHRLALIVFGARPQVTCPLTHDYDHLRDVLNDADPDNPLLEIQPKTQSAVSGTRIGAALTEAVRLCDERYFGYENILLLSDGDDPGGDDEWREGLAAAGQRGIRVDTVGIGDPDRYSPIPSPYPLPEGEGRVRGSPLTHEGMSVTTRLQETPLEEIARQTGGRYIPGRTSPIALGEIFRNAIEPDAQRAHEEDLVPARRQHSAWFFGAAFLCVAVAMLSGAVRSTPSAVFQFQKITTKAQTPQRHSLLPLCVFAFVVVGTPDFNSADVTAHWVERGNDAFERGDFTAALEAYSAAEVRTTDPGRVAFNKAATLYRLGRHREAELHYLRCIDNALAERAFAALYNAGNCIVQQAGDGDRTRLEAAINCYELALQRAATANIRTDDVEHNLRIARALLEKARTDSDRQRSTDADTSESTRRPGEGPVETDARHPGGMPGQSGERNNRSPGATSTDQLPPPGAGNLPLIPDTDELVALSAVDTARYLESVATRIHSERVRHRITHATIPSPRFRDW